LLFLLFLQQNNSDQRLFAAETLVWGEPTGARTAAIPLSICCFLLYLGYGSISDPQLRTPLGRAIAFIAGPLQMGII
jgi:hypothetical protein